MEKKVIRTLKASEIECRVQQVKAKGCVLLIYKDARVDMNLLDEIYGIEGWQRTHELINGNLFCTIEIWSEEKKSWIKKQDVGTESMTEKQKGQASDSFKRASFNVGIGRELYSAPFTWITLGSNEIKESNGKFSLNFGIKFSVKEIEYNEFRDISKLVIVDQTGKVRFTYLAKQPETKEALDLLKEIADNKAKLQACKSIEELATVYKSFKPHQQKVTLQIKDEMKVKLTPNK